MNRRMFTPEVVAYFTFILVVFTMPITSYRMDIMKGEALGLAVRLSELEGKVDVLQGQLDVLAGELESLRVLHRDSMEYIEKRLLFIEEDISKFKVATLTVTAYAPFDNESGQCNDGDPWSTATGTVPDWGTIAVNPAVFPYGTRFYIPDYGWGTAEDTGGAIRASNNLIDVYMDTHEQAIAWGRRTMQVLVEIEQ